MELAYEVVWMDAQGIASMNVRTSTGITKETLGRMCLNNDIVILTVRILWR